MDDEIKEGPIDQSEPTEFVAKEPVTEVSQLIERHRGNLRLTEGETKGRDRKHIEVWYEQYQDRHRPIRANESAPREMAVGIFITKGEPWELTVDSENVAVTSTEFDEVAYWVCSQSGDGEQPATVLTPSKSSVKAWAFDRYTGSHPGNNFGGYRPGTGIKEHTYDLRTNWNGLIEHMSLKKVPVQPKAIGRLENLAELDRRMGK